MRLSRRALGVAPSRTLAIDEKARSLARSGVRVWNFGAGQPDFPTPEVAAEAGIEAIHAGRTVYTSVAGTPELRGAIAAKLARENGVRVDPDQVLVAAGAKQAIYMALAALIEPGDEVLIPTPYWVSYPEQVRLLGGVPVCPECGPATGFKLTPEVLARHLGPRTRCLVLNSPGNPAGQVYSEAELRALMDTLLRTSCALLTDEIYEKIVYDGRSSVSAASLSPEVAARTITVNGVSKAFSMTGWRIGYAAGPKEWIDAAAAVQGHLTGNACSVSQDAAVGALTRAAGDVAAMAGVFARRRDTVLRLLAKAPGLSVTPPEGTFYVFPEVTALLGRRSGERFIETATDLADWLLDEARVAVVPGEAFGAPNHVRLSFATSEAVIEQGLGALAEALGRLD